MKFRTEVEIPDMPFKIAPCERLLFVGSCFADNIGKRFSIEKFRAVVNPYGVMYNPASISHSVAKFLEESSDELPKTVFLTLGTNHVYVLRETGEIVDNCMKRPQRLFEERELTVEECKRYLEETVTLLIKAIPDVRVVVTVSPIRYAKYGFHGSVLSKATLLLAAEQLVTAFPQHVTYFPAYEIVNDELRDYRFYQPDMLHPSQQTVDFIWQKLVDACFSNEAKVFLKEWKPIKEALAHKPFQPDSEEYRTFFQSTMEKMRRLREKYPDMPE